MQVRRFRLLATINAVAGSLHLLAGLILYSNGNAIVHLLAFMNLVMAVVMFLFSWHGFKRAKEREHV